MLEKNSKRTFLLTSCGIYIEVETLSLLSHPAKNTNAIKNGKIINLVKYFILVKIINYC